MFNLYADEREGAAFGGYASEMYAIGGNGASDPTTSPQSAESENMPDFSVKNWITVFIILFLFLYTVSRVLD